MRTTLVLDEDVFNIARQKAERDRVSIGAAVSEQVRQGIRSMQLPAVQRPAPRSKYVLLPARDEVITSEHVYKRMEQEGI
jgi:hypothetical protein